ncbi:DUF6491 family protein [Emcibacter nanhaiensis]|uniref:Uncharacterized protein n=1 Tax=Emcibacter nanhaiensis TaxID=1505037 RepID=A0A501PHD6_9PROT|nr:DUF6491 family protein [Emcibacter nanhaiensis]TPD59421.1 hypothetical protein FIV46_11545 [Emcibacter nanhaiensis]
MKKLMLMFAALTLFATPFTSLGAWAADSGGKVPVEEAATAEPAPLTDEQYKEMTKRLSRENDCIFIRTIDSWTALDRTHLLLYAPTRNHPYLLEVAPTTYNLMFEEQLAIYSKTGENLCPYGRSGLLLKDEHLFIRGIAKITKEEAQQLKAYKRAKKNK